MNNVPDKDHKPNPESLEDALQEPFAGVYATKMVPTPQIRAEERLRTLGEAIKFVYASTFFRQAKSYARAIGKEAATEKMAVVIQEGVGVRRDERFYPNLSGVCRSYNFYPQGGARPEDGVINLAPFWSWLGGLFRGEIRSFEGVAWSFAVAYLIMAAVFFITPYVTVKEEGE